MLQKQKCSFKRKKKITSNKLNAKCYHFLRVFLTHLSTRYSSHLLVHFKLNMLKLKITKDE